MRIITYSSENAPEERKWMAYWLVPFKERPDKLYASKEGIMQYSFHGSTEAEAVEKAQKGWDTSFGKNAKEKKLRESALSTTRVRARPQRGDQNAV